MTAQHEVRPGDAAADGPAARPAGTPLALDELGSLDELPVERHVDVYERAHRQLTDALADTDDA